MADVAPDEAFEFSPEPGALAPEPRAGVQRHDQGIARKNRGSKGPALTKRHLALIRFMVHGIDQAFPRWPDIEPHKPLDLNTAADIAGVRRRSARDLFNWPIFVTEYNAACAALRKGEHARSIHTMIAVRDDPGQGKAADRKVQLQASAALIGEATSGNSPNVNVSIGIGLQAGIVIDLRDDDEIDRDARVIEHDK